MQQETTAPAPPDQSRHHALQQWLSEHAKDLGKNHTTRQILWEEYRRIHPNGYAYTWFCHHIKAYLQPHQLTATPEHKPAHTLMCDFAGDPLFFYDRDTGAPIATCVPKVGLVPTPGCPTRP